MGYYIDLSKISLESYKVRLQTSDLLPSRRILKEDIDKRFEYFKNIGIKHVLELQQVLKRKNSFIELTKMPVFTEEYLKILLREINSYHPQPNKLNEFEGISKDAIEKLERLGIKDTVALFEKVNTAKLRSELSISSGIDPSIIIELTKLTDLSRIKWVGTMFARVLYESGFDTVGKVSEADFNELHHKITLINTERKLYKGQIGLNDMKLCVAAAKEVSLEIEYLKDLG
jgi:hypothetical protein